MYGSKPLEAARTAYSDDYREAVSALYSDEFFDEDDAFSDASALI